MLRKCIVCGKEYEGRPDSIKCPACVASEIRKNVYRTRTCAICGKEFLGAPAAKYCTDCRADRKREVKREYQKNGARRPLGSIDRCIACGKEYIVTSGTQKYCPECAPEEIRKNDRAQSRAWNRENVDINQQRRDRQSQAAEIKCVICGKMFRPGSGGNLTCSPECAEALSKRNHSKWEAAHREERNEYHRKKEAEKKEQMTPEQLRDRQEAVNARRRENYKKRMATMSPEELQKRREQKNAAARARYKRKKDEK